MRDKLFFKKKHLFYINSYGNYMFYLLRNNLIICHWLFVILKLIERVRTEKMLNMNFLHGLSLSSKTKYISGIYIKSW